MPELLTPERLAKIRRQYANRKSRDENGKHLATASMVDLHELLAHIEAQQEEHAALQALYDKALGRIVLLEDKIAALTELADAVRVLPARWWIRSDGITDLCIGCEVETWANEPIEEHAPDCPAAAVLAALAALDEAEAKHETRTTLHRR